MDETTILIAVFLAVLLVTFTAARAFLRSREIAHNLDRAGTGTKKYNQDIEKILGSGNEQIKYYLDVVQNDPPDSLRRRLVQAGFFSRSALTKFNLIRFSAAAAAFLAVQIGISATFEALSNMMLIVFSMIAAGTVFVLSSAFLEGMGKRRTREYRKLFPDFMDLLLVCVDAGLSLDAAIDRVTREFLLTTPDFGVQLSIISLEIRAGRPLHEALSNFSERIQVQEAKTLAVLFKQSEELGASVSKTLRVFSREMRQLRIIRAEEKANALPIKMLFPMALFMFPVNLIIVLVPILLVIMRMLLSLSPS